MISFICKMFLIFLVFFIVIAKLTIDPISGNYSNATAIQCSAILSIMISFAVTWLTN